MHCPRLLAATAAVFVFLLVVNALVFPILFPDGLAEKFVNARKSEQSLFHVLALPATMSTGWSASTRARGATSAMPSTISLRELSSTAVNGEAKTV